MLIMMFWLLYLKKFPRDFALYNIYHSYLGYKTLISVQLGAFII